jgi:hypothetical protein
MLRNTRNFETWWWATVALCAAGLVAVLVACLLTAAQ